MIKLHRRCGIPRNAVIPPPIEMKGLFSLDVDNDIWQDIGLANDEFGGQHWFNDESAALITVLQASKEDADLQFFLWEHAQWLIDLGKRWGCSIDALAPNVAQSKVGQSEVGQSEVGQSKVGQSKVGQSRVGQSRVGQSEVGQSEVGQSKVTQSKVAQSEVAQYKVAQSEVTQSDMPQSGISWADFPQQGGRTLTSETKALLDCRVPIPPLSKLAGSLAEQAAIPKLPRSDKWTVGPAEGEVDSSDDDEEFELEPWPVIADPVLLTATDLLHEGHSDDMGSETSSDEE
ncbi:hypothetical protein BS47DRAFT_1369564 [Hydnum rufescens UP504]|uniref:Uncharacterized protein n=1 Tax=Hydnum rufescens UP504 TaxID=1448309 RepID=A0A9P6ACG8_9AGAM|nr:hypothetical protein BS47DRAFT_1369564 [Hydnum rufescens UP504]